MADQNQFRSREQQQQAPPRAQPAAKSAPRPPLGQQAPPPREERAPAQPQVLPANLTISPTAQPGNSPSIGFEWRTVDLDSNKSYGCTVSTASGEPITLTVNQPPYQRTFRGQGTVTLTAIPAAPMGKPGELTARNDATGATAAFRWVWVLKSGATPPPPSTPATAAPQVKAIASPQLASTQAAKPAAATNAAFFGQHAVGRRIAFILDMSGSMQGLRWATLQTEFARALRQLPPSVQCFVVTFCTGSFVPPNQSDWVSATREKVDLLISWIECQRPWGGTLPGSAFHKVFSLSSPPDTIYFLTDGRLETFGPAECAQIRGAHGTVIHTIALDDSASVAELEQIATQTGGRFVHVSCPKN